MCEIKKNKCVTKTNNLNDVYILLNWIIFHLIIRQRESLSKRVGEEVEKSRIHN